MNTAFFTELTICGLDELGYRSAEGVTHVLSILDPGWPEPAAFRAFGPHLRTTLRFHDAIERAPDVVLPQTAHINAILAFGRNRISNGALNAARLSEIDDAESRGVRDSVGSAGGVELVEKRTDMKLDGMN